jgi:hypothetical protein
MADYRDAPFEIGTLRSYARVIAGDYYRKLYISENILRAVIFSVLRVQAGPDWWEEIVDDGTKGRAIYVRNIYMEMPTPRSPGKHRIYCVYLSNLGKILLAAKGYFYHVFPAVERLIVSIEQVRPSRNLVGHMNVLTANDKARITRLHTLCVQLAEAIARSPVYTFEYPFEEEFN